MDDFADFCLKSAIKDNVESEQSSKSNYREYQSCEVEEVYLLAYENGAKGVTVYRDGSKQLQILNISEKKKDVKKAKGKASQELSDYYSIQTGHGPLHLHINYNEEGPTRVFANIPPMGTEISGLTGALAILLSKYLGLGGDPARILKHLNSIKSERPHGFGKNRTDSIPHAISIALRSHLTKTGKIKTIDQKLKTDDKDAETDMKLHCPKCFSANVGMVSGCPEPTCFDCGYSKC